MLVPPSGEISGWGDRLWPSLWFYDGW